MVRVRVMVRVWLMVRVRVRLRVRVLAFVVMAMAMTTSATFHKCAGIDKQCRAPGRWGPGRTRSSPSNAKQSFFSAPLTMIADRHSWERTNFPSLLSPDGQIDYVPSPYINAPYTRTHKDTHFSHWFDNFFLISCIDILFLQDTDIKITLYENSPNLGMFISALVISIVKEVKMLWA